MRAKPLPSLEYLDECFELSSKSPSGILWKARPRYHFNTDAGFRQSNGRFKGKPAGNIWKVPNSDLEYWNVEIMQKVYKVHRVVYSMANQCEVAGDILIDHKDTDGLNNDPDNLRLANEANNSHNRKIPTTNKSGFKGVSWCTVTKSWVVMVTHLGVKRRKRGFMTPESASEYAIELRLSLHKEFSRNN